MMRRMVPALLLAVMAAATAVEAQVPRRGQARQGEAMEQRRAQLEEQVRQRFLAQVSDRLVLDGEQEARLNDVMRRGAEARRALARESRQLRQELVQAVEDETTPALRFRELLDRMAAIRAREQALERREAEALAGFLDARQQAEFLILRMHLNERVRGMGPGAGRGGPPGQRRRPQ